MKKIIFFLIAFLGFYQGVFAWGGYGVISDGVLAKSVIISSGSSVSWGHAGFQHPITMSGLVQISDGGTISCGIKTDKTLVCSNGSTNTGSFVQISVGYQNEWCGILTDGRAYCKATNGTFYYGGPSGYHFSEVVGGNGVFCGISSDSGHVGYMTCWGSSFSVIGGGGWKQITMGDSRACLIASDNTVSCVGGTTPPSGTFKKIRSGGYYDYFCGIKTDDSISCWGSQPPTNNIPPSGTFRDLSIGQFGSCAIKISDDLLYCWGDNTFGEITNAPYILTYLPVPPSDGSISSGCYVKDVESGKTLLPYLYVGTTSSVIDDLRFYNEDVYNIRTGYTDSYWDYVSSGFKSRNWLVYSSKNSYTGSLIEVLKSNSGSFVNYKNAKPTLTFNLYSSVSFGDESTTNFESTGSNAINYIRVVTDKGWHLEALVIKNKGTSSSPNNSEDWGYTRFDSSSGSVFLPLGQVARKFRIVFDDYSPTIFSIDWGSYTRTVSSETVCSPRINTIKTYLNGQVTSATGQAVFVTNLTESLTNAILNQSGTIVQSEYSCPKDILDLTVPGLGWTSWGVSKHVPVIDFDIDIKPFGMLECPLKTIFIISSKFQ